MRGFGFFQGSCGQALVKEVLGHTFHESSLHTEAVLMKDRRWNIATSVGIGTVRHLVADAWV